MAEKNTLYCSFCGKSQHEVDKLVAGPSIFICNECTDPTGSSTATSRHEQKPAKSRLMVPLAVLCGVMMAFLARVGLVGQVGPPTPERPNSCSLYDAEQKKCASGKL